MQFFTFDSGRSICRKCSISSGPAYSNTLLWEARRQVLSLMMDDTVVHMKLFSLWSFSVLHGLGDLGRKWRATLAYDDPRFLRGYSPWSTHCTDWPCDTLTIQLFFMAEWHTMPSEFITSAALQRQRGASLMEP